MSKLKKEVAYDILKLAWRNKWKYKAARFTPQAASYAFMFFRKACKNEDIKIKKIHKHWSNIPDALATRIQSVLDNEGVRVSLRSYGTGSMKNHIPELERHIDEPTYDNTVPFL